MLVNPGSFPAAELQFVYVIAWLFPVTLVTLFLVFLRTRATAEQGESIIV